MKLEDASLAEDDIIIVEIKKQDCWTFQPLSNILEESKFQDDAESTDNSSTQSFTLSQLDKDITSVLKSGSKKGITGL